MRSPEWSLILFTLLTQLAAGTFLVIETVNTLYLSKSNSIAAREFVVKGMVLIIAVLVLAIAASFLHIGKPRNALYAVSHFSRSWLSREILFLLLFTFLAGLSAVLHHLWGGTNLFLKASVIITGSIGLVTIAAMAKVYMLETVPAWNTLATPVQFITTSLLLGGTAAIVLLIIFGNAIDSGELSRMIIRRLLPVLLFLISVNLISFLMHLFYLPGAGIAGAESYILLTAQHFLPLILRFSLILASIILLLILLLAGTRASAAYLLILLCCIVLISELVGRYLFYAAYSRVGM